MNPKPEASNPVRGLLLDLDGTLVDTAPDMADALVRLQQERGLTPLPYNSIRPWVSHGSAAMVRIGFGVDTGDDQFPELRDAFLARYAERVSERSTLFPGMEEVLRHCQAHQISWGVVTNKPGFLTEPLMAGLGLSEKASCIVSGDTVARRKPDAMPLLHACMLMRLAPSDCVYVGDAKRDIESGRRAGTRTLVAGWGYIGEEESPAEWGAQRTLAKPLDLIDYLGA